MRESKRELSGSAPCMLHNNIQIIIYDSAYLPDFPSFAVDRPPSLDSACIVNACDLAGWPCPSSFQSLRRRMRISAAKRRKKRGRHVRRSRMLVVGAVSETIPSASSRRHPLVVRLGIQEEGRGWSSVSSELVGEEDDGEDELWPALSGKSLELHPICLPVGLPVSVSYRPSSVGIFCMVLVLRRG